MGGLDKSVSFVLVTETAACSSRKSLLHPPIEDVGGGARTASPLLRLLPTSLVVVVVVVVGEMPLLRWRPDGDRAELHARRVRRLREQDPRIAPPSR